MAAPRSFGLSESRRQSYGRGTEARLQRLVFWDRGSKSSLQIASARKGSASSQLRTCEQKSE